MSVAKQTSLLSTRSLVAVEPRRPPKTNVGTDTAILSCRYGPQKNHEKSGWVHFIWNRGQVLTAGCGETPGRARTFISDQSKEVFQDRERRRKLHRCIQTAIDSARRDWSSARRDWRLFFQTFQPSFVISWPISTNEPSLESLKSKQSDGAIFVPVSPRERTIAPFLRRVLTLSAQFPPIRTCSGHINLYRGEIAVRNCFRHEHCTHFQKSKHLWGQRSVDTIKQPQATRAYFNYIDLHDQREGFRAKRNHFGGQSSSWR